MFCYFYCFVVIIIIFNYFVGSHFLPVWVATRSVWVATHQTERVGDPMDSTVGSPTQPLTNHSQTTRKSHANHSHDTRKPLTRPLAKIT